MGSEMLTAQQVQDLLDIDASTVYRMAGDGRLPAVRIGRQWRFPAEAIEKLLIPTAMAGPNGAPGVRHHAVPEVAEVAEVAGIPGTPVTPGTAATTATAGNATAPGGAAAAQAPAGEALAAGDVPATTDTDPVAVLSSDTTTAVLELVAPLLGVTMVVTDLGGDPISAIVNPAPAIEARLEDPGFLETCQSEWRGFAAEPHLAPRLQQAEGGFLCAHALVRRGTTLIAMVLAGGIAPDDEPDLYHLDADARREVLDTLPRTAALLSRLATDAAAMPAQR